MLAAGGAESLDVYFLNVGHGDAILIDLNHWEILIDTGTKQFWGESSYCVELLDRVVSQPIEVFVLSHPDADHYNGFEFISQRYGIVSIWHGPDPADDDSGREFLRDVVPAFCERTLSWAEAAAPIVTGPLQWEALHPATDADGEDDDNSLVLKMTYGNTIFLFTGDIHSTGQDRVVNRFPEGVVEPWQTAILKLPHHGSTSHVVDEFLRWANADYAICSSDEDCGYALQVCGSLGISAYSTLGFRMIRVHQSAPDDEPRVDQIE